MTKFWFDHLHLVVADPEKMADFFEKASVPKESVSESYQMDAQGLNSRS